MSFNGSLNGKRSNTTHAHRRINWNNQEDFDAVLCLALGISARSAMKYSGLKGTTSRVYNRGRKADMSSKHYRNMVRGTIGGDLAYMMLQERKSQITPIVRRELKDPMPTKHETQLGAGRVTSRIAATRYA